jgi:hypothetical protein
MKAVAPSPTAPRDRFRRWLLHKPAGSSGLVGTIAGMSQNFIVCDREQELLLPPSLREWLPEGHLAWFVLAAVDEMDLSGFYGAYRLDGHGRPAHEPAMMVGHVGRSGVTSP